MGSCGAFCSFCGRCGKTVEKTFAGNARPANVAPPGESARDARRGEQLRAGCDVDETKRIESSGNSKSLPT